MALMALLNGIVGYVGSLIGYPHWNLELFFGYAFFPIAYLIGVTDNLEETMVGWIGKAHTYRPRPTCCHLK
jgi:nucleoside permease NupC